MNSRLTGSGSIWFGLRLRKLTHYRLTAPIVVRGSGASASSCRAVLHGASARTSTAAWTTGRTPMGACLCAEHSVGGAAHRGRATVEDVRVDHRGGDVAVPANFLNRADVVPVFKQVGRERVPEGVPDG